MRRQLAVDRVHEGHGLGAVVAAQVDHPGAGPRVTGGHGSRVAAAIHGVDVVKLVGTMFRCANVGTRDFLTNALDDHSAMKFNNANGHLQRMSSVCGIKKWV